MYRISSKVYQKLQKVYQFSPKVYPTRPKVHHLIEVTAPPGAVWFTAPPGTVWFKDPARNRTGHSATTQVCQP